MRFGWNEGDGFHQDYGGTKQTEVEVEVGVKSARHDQGDQGYLNMLIGAKRYQQYCLHSEELKLTLIKIWSQTAP